MILRDVIIVYPHIGVLILVHPDAGIAYHKFLGSGWVVAHKSLYDLCAGREGGMSEVCLRVMTRTTYQKLLRVVGCIPVPYSILAL
jgi:hypothetical protein